MKTPTKLAIVLTLCSTTLLMAQQANRGARQSGRQATVRNGDTTRSSGDFATDLKTVNEAQDQALEQAQQMLEEGESVKDKPALENAIKDMQKAKAALEAAADSPDKLPAAIAAEQSAYQALVKLTPREHRMTRSQKGSQGSSSSESNRKQMDQLEMKDEKNRYETERQATAAQKPQQKEQIQTADKLKELAQRQQDLNEKLKELQTSLQMAKTETEKEEIKRQLKRLKEEERQMMAKVDEMQQQLAQSPNSSAMSEAQKQLEQTRNDMQKAAEELDKESASKALAAGTRAQEGMQNLRQDLKKQAAGQFSDQARDLRNQAREMARQQEEISKELDALNNGEKQKLDNSPERKKIEEQLAQQKSSLTNLLANMKSLTESSEATEPVLSKQLYDTLRRADQMKTENLLEMNRQLVNRGFLPQATQVEKSARTNIMDLKRSVERAAESVLGNEADALKFAQKELDDLANQVEAELGGSTNSPAGRAGSMNASANGGTNGNRQAQTSRASRNGVNGTNALAQADGQQRSPAQQGQDDEQPGQGQQGKGQSQNPGEGQGQSRSTAQNGQQGQQPQQGEGQQNQGQQPGQSQEQQSAQQQGQGQRGQGQQGRGQRQVAGGQQRGGNQNGGGGDIGGLRNLVQRLGQNQEVDRSTAPITGGGFLNWSDRLRDVEAVTEPTDLRNQLATARERLANLRADFRDRGKNPDGEVIRQQVLMPLTQVRTWLREELAKQENANSLVPLDRDPVPEHYTELVRKYYEKLGSAQ